jgi:hypothetical protein
MNFTQTFEEFSTGLGPTDLALYAGVGVVLWVLFKDKLSPIQEMLLGVFNKVKNQIPKNINVIVPEIPDTFPSKPITTKSGKTDVFFDLVVSWKQTRDLAVQSGCDKAVEVADQMFPYLSPTICEDSETANE